MMASMLKLLTASAIGLLTASALGAIAVKDGEKIAFLGDSITNFGSREPGGYVNLVIDGLSRCGIKVEKIPAGVSGDKSHQMLARFDKDVAEKKPDWVTVSAGVNDVGWGEKGNELEPFKKYMIGIFDKADKAGIKVLVMTPSFCREAVGYSANPNNVKLEGYAQFLREESARRGYLLADVNADFRRIFDSYQTKRGPVLTIDNLHMNGYGNQIIAAAVLKAFGVEEKLISEYIAIWTRTRPSMIPIFNAWHSPKHLVTIDEYKRLEVKAKVKKQSVEEYVFSLIKDAARPVVTPSGGEVFTVQDVPGYNSWQMIQAIGKRLVCAYSRGSAHTIHEGARNVYVRHSDDGGKTWSEESTVTDSAEYGEVTIGKGLDRDGAMLLWVRSWGGRKPHHDLFRSKDGVKFEKISTPELSPLPMQITDVFDIPGMGLMSLWFAGNYRKDAKNSWGTLLSTDNGRTWTQHTVEKDLPKSEWPTEQSAVYLGDGKILGIARSEGGAKYQFQLTSTDGGKTWKKQKTNISDVRESTPSLVFDRERGILSNYYYQRGARQLKRRIVDAAWIFDRPQEWSEPQVLAVGAEERAYDAGNVSVTTIGNRHFPAFYTGSSTDTAVFVVPVAAP